MHRWTHATRMRPGGVSRGTRAGKCARVRGLGICNLMQSLDVGAWLEELGLGQYRALFSDQAIDTDVLPDLTDDDLVRLGVNDRNGIAAGFSDKEARLWCI